MIRAAACLCGLIVFTGGLTLSVGAAAAIPNAQSPAVESNIEIVADGAEIFDNDDASGHDSSATNGRVRNFDLVKYRVELALNDADDTNLVAIVTLNDKAEWTGLPSQCLKVADGFSVSPDSGFADEDSDGLAETLTCNLGAHGQGTKLTVFPVARSNGSEGEKMGASVVSDSDNNVNSGQVTAGSKAPDVTITSGFGVNVNHTVGGLPVVDEHHYQQTHIPDAHFGREGRVVDWQVDLVYDRGSEMVENTNGVQSFTVELTWEGSHSDCSSSGPDCDIEGDNANGDYSDGVVLLGELDATADDCALLSRGGTVTCSQSGPGEPVIVQFTDVPVNQATFGSTSIKLFYPHDVIFDPNGISTSETYMVDSHATIINWGGAGPLLTSVSGAVDAAPHSGTADWLVNLTEPGRFSVYKSFDQFATGKTAARAAARGEVIETSLWLEDTRSRDTVGGICDTLDTNSFEFVGATWPGPGQQDSRDHAGYWHRFDNPVLSTWFSGNVSNRGFYPALDFGVTVEFSDVDYTVTGDDHWTATCEDDLDGDGTNDWVDDYNTLAGGASSVTRVRVIWNRDYDDLLARTQRNHTGGQVGFSFDLRITRNAPIGEIVANAASVFIDDWNGWTSPTSGQKPDGSNTSHPYVNIVDDPNDSDFSFNSFNADRVVIVPASLSVNKRVSDDTGPGPFVPGDEIVFEVDALALGSNASGVTIMLEDTLPPQLEYVSDTCETVYSTTPYSCDSVASGQTVTWTISNYTVGEVLPRIKITTRLRTGITSGTLINTVIADSDLGALVDDSHCVNPVLNQTRCQNALASRLRGFASVVTIGQSGFAVTKVDDFDEIEQGDQWVTDLVINNLGGSDIATGQIIDVLPFNGDGFGDGTPPYRQGSTYRRNLENVGSSYDSTFTSDPSGRAVFVDVEGSLGTEAFEYATTTPADIDHRPCHPSNWPAGEVVGGGNTLLNTVCAGGLLDTATDKPDPMVKGAATTDWSDTQPADLADITALRVTFTDLAKGQEEDVSLTLSSGAPAPGNLFCNNFGANTTVSVFDVISNDVCVEVAGVMYDVALRKTVNAKKFNPGDTIRFQLEVFNQGEFEVTDVVVRDQLPDGVTLVDQSWFDNGSGVASAVIPGPIAAGDSVVVTMNAVISDLALGELTNSAEITEIKDKNGDIVVDFDSTADHDPNNDLAIDDVVDSCPICGLSDGLADEDDHDVAVFAVEPKGTLALTGSGLTPVIVALGVLTSAVGLAVSRGKARAPQLR